MIFVYPWTGRPDHPNPPNWDDISGAHGSTPELEGVRDHAADFAALKVALFGLSRQTTDWQRELVERLRLPFAILSDAHGGFAEALALPTFATGGDIYLKRLTLVVNDGRVDRVFYPVPHPESHAAEVLRWLRGQPGLERFVLGVLDGIAEPVEPLFEIVREHRHAEEILPGAVGALGPRRLERLVELLGAERTASDPGQRHEACLLVLVQIGDEAFELGPGGIVAEGLEDGVGVMIGGGAVVSQAPTLAAISRALTMT